MIIRQATPQDLSYLESIENAADQLFIDTFAPCHWEPAPCIDERLKHGGTILVAVPSSTSDPVLNSASGSGSESDLGVEPVGFVHVIYPCEGVVHIEALAVRPEFGRRGYGRALVDSAIRLAREGREGRAVGAGWVTLRTYAGLPWNEGFYSRCGFGRVEVESGEMGNGKRGINMGLENGDEKELGEESEEMEEEMGELGNEEKEMNKGGEKELKQVEGKLGDLLAVEGFRDFMERCRAVEENLGLMKYGERIVMATRLD